MAQEVNDDTVLSFGRYQGRKLGDTPAWYLLSLIEHDWCRNNQPNIYNYIVTNQDLLIKEKEEEHD